MQALHRSLFRLGLGLLLGVALFIIFPGADSDSQPQVSLLDNLPPSAPALFTAPVVAEVAR